MIFLRTVPPELIQGVTSGLYTVTGSVVRDVASGKGVAFLQETGLLESLLHSAISSGGNPYLMAANLGLSVTSTVQNQQIKARLVEVQETLALVQDLQIGTLAVSGLGLGVSAVGFAVMLKKLKGIEDHLGTIESKVDTVTSDRRSDDVRMIFADIGTQLDTVDTLSARFNKVNSAEAAERALATSAGRLEVHFQQKSEAMQSSAMTTTDMDMLWSLAAAIRLCHEAGLRALYSIDELEAAKQLAERRAQRMLNLSQGMTPDALARLCAQNAKDATAYAEARRMALQQSEVLVRGLRESVAAISSQAELAQNLIAKQISGAAYLEGVAKQTDEPLLVLPA